MFSINMNFSGENLNFIGIERYFKKNYKTCFKRLGSILPIHHKNKKRGGQ